MTDYAVFPEQRQARIGQLLAETGRVMCADLARKLGVSEHTIRRDLQVLASQGLCKKVYGGAVSQMKQSASFEVRASQHVAEKAQVAKSCAQLLKADSCVFIDAGSTYLAMVELMPLTLALTIVTNSPQIAAALASRPQIELILLGGKVNPLTGSTLGADTAKQLTGMVFDQTFIGVCGLDPQAGLTAVYYEDACFKREVLSQSNQVIAAVTADKLPQVARYRVASCDEIDIAVVSQQTDISAFSQVNLPIVVAE
ncbi:DeoR/GlpR family DNA-binding transcription regulator [Utexia brackfieldae]|uniref:DeoR/GlpR family DNA-binding transcription regulator n=1 Tax=Utexia brackfieldae TaxID=3074108 RepID=UPI00370D24CA